MSKENNSRQPRFSFVAQSDNTKVKRPVISTPIQRTLKPGEHRIKINGKTLVVKPIQTILRQDNRGQHQRNEDQKRSKVLRKQYEEEKNKEETMKTVGALTTLTLPSTYIGPLFNGNGKSYMDNLMSGEGTGNADADLAINFATPVVLGAGIQGASRASRWVSKSYKPFIISQYMYRSQRPNGLNIVNNMFRNSEWSNFLSTKNGNYYYRMQRSPGLVSTNVRKDNGGYFISHTTPWEEFAGLGSTQPHWSKVLYEFPESTFGKLRASNSNGFYGPYDVAELGKLHLLYGNTSSGSRDFVRILTDDKAKQLGMDPFVIGIKDRPKLSNGLYDKSPIYEKISQGNQTVVRPEILNNALQNTSYNAYYYSPQGIIKSIYIPN